MESSSCKMGKKIKMKRRGKKGMEILIGVLVVVVVLVALMAGSIVIQNQKPQITLGLENGKLREIPSKPNCVSTQTAYEEKRIEPLNFKDSLESSKKAMKKALQEYGGIEIKKEEANYIYAIATTSKMKYHDDIEIYFDDSTKLIQYRSASRAGYSDMGLNRERYEKLVEAYGKN